MLSEVALITHLSDETATSAGASVLPLPGLLRLVPSFPQDTCAPSTSTQSPPTLQRAIAKPIAVRIRLSIASPVTSETPHSLAIAWALEAFGSITALHMALNHLAGGSFV